jgi:ABC-type Zn uptake system ZnuABC Zn-binding protein ZnuA
VRKKILIGLLIAVVIGAPTTYLVLAQEARSTVDIMAGSSLIANIVHDVAGDTLTTRSIVPADTCPGQDAVSPDDIKALITCKALLIHDYEQYFATIADAVAAATENNPGLNITVIDVAGNWMIPEVQAEAVSAIAMALGQIYPENAALYEQRASERERDILAHGQEVEAELHEAGVDGLKVICADRQADFAAWAGFDIVATFGRPEDLSPTVVAQLVDQARQAGAVLIIDNLQSGSTTLGASIELEPDVEAVPVTLSNFPAGFANTGTWEDAIDENVTLLLEALGEWEARYG